MNKKTFEFASNKYTERYRREIQLLINIQQPDPEYQPLLITDESLIFDFITDDEPSIRQRFTTYFEQPFTLSLSQPIWKLVEQIQIQQPDWPG